MKAFSFLFGLVSAGAAKASNDVRVVNVVGECQKYTGTACADRLEADAEFFIPVKLELSNGSSVSFSQKEMEKHIEQGFSSANFIKDMLSADSCYEEMIDKVCPFSFKKCTTVNGRAIPLLNCANVCIELWGECHEQLTIASSFGFNRITKCNYTGDGVWETIPAYPLIKDFGRTTTDFFTKEFINKRSLVENDEYTVEIGGQALAFNCSSRKGRGSSGSSITSCGAPFVKVATDESITCRLPCPLNPFQEEKNMKVIPLLERVFSALSLPLLITMALFEMNNARVNQKRPNLYICLVCASGVLFSCLSIAFVSEHETGCDSSSSFKRASPSFWNETQHQRIACQSTRLCIHVLQIFTASILCFMLQLYRNFTCALEFSTPTNSKSFTTMIALILVVLPGIGITCTVWFAAVREVETIWDNSFLWDSVRYLHKCGPSYPFPWLEAWLGTMPIIGCVAGCGIVSTRLFLTSSKVLRNLRIESVRGEKAAYLKQTTRLAKQMMLFSGMAAVLLIVQLSSELFLRSKMSKFGEQVGGQVFCDAFSASQIENCENVEYLDDTAFSFLIINSVGWSILPLAFGLIFISSIAARRPKSLGALFKPKRQEQTVHTSRSKPPTSPTSPRTMLSTRALTTKVVPQ